jgi:hypothetical protein
VSIVLLECIGAGIGAGVVVDIGIDVGVGVSIHYVKPLRVISLGMNLASEY